MLHNIRAVLHLDKVLHVRNSVEIKISIISNTFVSQVSLATTDPFHAFVSEYVFDFERVAAQVVAATVVVCQPRFDVA